MSADLFAEFNDISSNPAPASDPAPGPTSGLSAAQSPAPGWSQSLLTLEQSQESDAADGDDDGWGDFEVADPAPPPPISHGHQPSDFMAQRLAHSRIAPAAATVDLQPQNHRLDMRRLSPPVSKSSSAHSWSQPPMPKTRLHAGPSDPNVLFDADDFELSPEEAEDDEVDEFGDFATATRSPSLAAPVLDPVPSIDLLGLEVTSQPRSGACAAASSTPTGPLSFGASMPSHTQPWKLVSGRSQVSVPDPPDKTSEKGESSAKDEGSQSGIAVAADPGQASQDGDDGWRAWDDLDSVNAPTNPVTDGSRQLDTWDWDVVDGGKPTATEPSNDGPPPINVPPPSVILSAFPDLLSSGDSLFKSISGQSSAVKEHVLSDPKTIQFLQGYILIGITAARVMAGRKHRWHRDKMLANSMSISSAGSKGMKLAGVDKTQSVREDRESADVLAVWREHVGRLRAAVATAKASGKANGSKALLDMRPEERGEGRKGGHGR